MIGLREQSGGEPQQRQEAKARKIKGAQIFPVQIEEERRDKKVIWEAEQKP